MKGRLKRNLVLALALVLTGFGAWEYPAFQAIHAIANLGDPAKLATLRERGANSRLNKIIYWLDQARRHWMPPDAAIAAAQVYDGTHEPRAGLVKSSLMRNLKIADELGLLTSENREHLRRGHAAVITRGPYAGETVEIDHIVPISLAPELGNELANLEMLAKSLNRHKSNRVGPRQLAHAEKLFEAGLLTRESYARVKAKAE